MFYYCVSLSYMPLIPNFSFFRSLTQTINISWFDQFKSIHKIFVSCSIQPWQPFPVRQSSQDVVWEVKPRAKKTMKSTSCCFECIIISESDTGLWWQDSNRPLLREENPYETTEDSAREIGFWNPTNKPKKKETGKSALNWMSYSKQFVNSVMWL